MSRGVQLVGKRIRVCSMQFVITRYDPRHRRFILRNTRTRLEHAIQAHELYGYLADESLRAHLELIEEDKGES